MQHKNPTLIPSIHPPIYEFAKASQRTIWDGVTHRTTSMRKVKAFSSYLNYSTLPIDQIAPSHIYAYLEWREDTLGNSDATLNRYIACLNKVLKHFYEEIRSGNAPRLKWRKEMGGRPRFFSKVEQAQLLDMFLQGENPWAYHFTIIMLKTGMRTREVLNIGLTSEEVAVDETYGALSLASRSVTLYQTKNGTSREVPLTKEAFNSLQALEFKPTLTFNHHKWYQEWERARRWIAPKDLTFVPHVCRHTAASSLAQTFNIKIIAELLGHKTIVTTAKYIHTDQAMLSKMVNTL